MAVLLRVLMVLALCGLAGCATGPGRGQPIDDAQARALYDGGDFAGAAQAWLELARRHRRARDAFTLLAAESWREEGDWSAVEQTLSKIKRANLAEDESARLDLLLAELALARGDGERALALATLPAEALVPGQRLRLSEVRARALVATGRYLDAARERHALQASLPAADQRINEEQLLETLVLVEVSELNTALAELPPRDPMRSWYERALRLKGSVPPRTAPRASRAVGTLLPGEAREGYAPAPRVALLLPLSGALASAGAAIRDGFFAAYFADRDSARPQVQVLDAGETVDSATAAFQRAAELGVERVVGPLARDQVEAVQKLADSTVPVLALNHPESGDAPPVGSQQFGLSPDDEAAFVAESALGRGFRRAAIFALEDEWAQRAVLAFRAQFEVGGGSVVGEARVASGAVDLAGPITEGLREPADVVVLVLRPPEARLLVPQLRARGLATTPILGTSHLYAGSVNRALDRDLSGVEFCDAPWLYGLAAGVPSRDALARALPAASHSPRLFAFGIDAYRLLGYLKWLSEHPDAYLAGASGQLTVDDLGRVRRTLAWLRFLDGAPRPADGALAPEAP